MARAIVVKTTDDDKLWLVNLDERSVAEIASDSIGDPGLAILEADVVDASSARSAAAAHPLYVVQ